MSSQIRISRNLLGELGGVRHGSAQTLKTDTDETETIVTNFENHFNICIFFLLAVINL